jgi:hypothetical protein
MVVKAAIFMFWVVTLCGLVRGQVPTFRWNFGPSEYYFLF